MAMRRTRAVLTVLVLSALWSACGDDEAPPAAAPTGTFDVVTVDYAYRDLPESAAVGTELTLSNASPTEVHEAVVIKVNPGEDRPTTELVKLGQDGLSRVATLAGVLVAMPGETALAPLGPVVLADPGRYLLLCFIPTGADPAAFAEAAAESRGGPVDVPGGPPHAAQGMFAELRVQS